MSELSVLIVEDDADFRASVASLVGRDGYRTRVITSYSIHYTKLYEANSVRQSFR